eukprot:15436356-Alexandrium_andersonii.AAC.1
MVGSLRLAGRICGRPSMGSDCAVCDRAVPPPALLTTGCQEESDRGGGGAGGGAGVGLGSHVPQDQPLMYLGQHLLHSST